MAATTRIIIVIAVLVVSSNYLAALTITQIYSQLEDITINHTGYIALLASIPPLIILLADLASYTAASTPIIAKHAGHIDARRLAKGYIYASAPVIALYIPILATGVADIASNGAYREAVAYTIYVWNAATALYALFIHPVYAPYTSLVAAHWATRATGGIDFIKQLARNIRLAPWTLAAAIAASLLAAGTVSIASQAAPPLKQPILELETRPIVEGGWAWKWLKAASTIMPKYSTIITDTLRYTLYTLILSKPLANKVKPRDN